MTILSLAVFPMLLTFALSALAAPPTYDRDASQLKRQADAWDLAIVKKDRKAIQSKIGAHFMQIGSDGSKADETAFVANLMDDRLTIAPYTVEDFEVRVEADTALVTGITKMHGTWDGKAFSSHYRFTDVYIRNAGQWRVVNVQTTPIRE